MSETIQSVGEQVVAEFGIDKDGYVACEPSKLAVAINNAIGVERERCAKIAERPRLQDAMYGVVCTDINGYEIAAEIRKQSG